MEYKIQGHEILLIDDEFDSVRPLIRMLEKEGCKTQYAANATEALQAVERTSFDLIIIDVILGRDNGFDLFQKIRERPALSEVPILFLSGVTQIDATIAGLNLGAGDFILKPYNLREIAARISLQLRLSDNEKLLKNRNQELARAYDDLRAAQATAIHAEKLAAIGRLAAGIAHEMSTPLSFIISNLKTLEQYIEKVDRAILAYHNVAAACVTQGDQLVVAGQASDALELRQRLDLDNILRELRDLSKESVEGAEIIAKIANDLREFSREEYEDRVSSDIHALIDKALNLVRNELGSRIQVKRDYGSIPSFSCIPGRMTQLFVIVLVNAAQAIDGEGEIRIHSRQQDGHLMLTLSDTGRGIKEEILPHIFEPFYTTKPAEVGTGLGLSIARKIAEFHGGAIAIRSEVGRGTDVTLSFPLDKSKG
jgi:two-component system NtrC family sensor kinase